MISRLSLNSLRKIYYILVNSNPDVNFYCMCMKNRKKEAVSQNLILYGLELIRINLICRIPFLKLQNAGQKLGKTYLSEVLVRTAVYDLASRVIQYRQLTIDLFDCILVSPGSDGEHGPADSEAVGRDYIVNPYMRRLLDIARYNRIEICLLIDTDYPDEVVIKLLEKYELPYDRYQSRAKQNINKKELLDLCHTDSATYVSTDYKMIRQSEKKGYIPLYYRAPHALLQYVEQPALSADFARVYHTLCSMHLFNGERRYSFAYEHSFLCLAPALTGFMQHVAAQVKPGQQVIFLCDEYSMAFQLYQSYSGDAGIIADPAARYEGSVLIVDPVPGAEVAVEFIGKLESDHCDVRYEKITMSEYLGVTEKETRAFARILRANLPGLSWSAAADAEAAYTFETMINPEVLREIRQAIFDFMDLFSQYAVDNNPDFKIKAKDAASLLVYAKAVTKELTDAAWVN